MNEKPTTPTRILLSIIFSCILFSIDAQNPGGIATAPQFWVKGDYSTGKMTIVSGKTSEWINEKSTFKITQGTSTKRPIRYDGSSSGLSVDSLNYSPHVTFIGSTQDHLTNSATTPDLLGAAGTTFTVSNQDAGSKSAVTYMSNNVFRYQVKPNFRVQTSDGIAILSPLNTSPGYTSDFSSTYNSPKSNARITTSRGFAATLTSRRNSTPYTLTNSNTAPFCPGIGAGIFVGANPTNAEYFDGKIAEVIFYNTVLSDADVQKVESYLAIKYGITLNPAGLDNTNGYVSSAGVSLYSKGITGTTYWNNIIGLGRDDNTVLYQKQSHQYDDSVRLYSTSLAATNVANTTTITNNTFLMAGSTTGKLYETAATAFEVPTVVRATINRLDREWKLINTGYNLSYTMQFKLNSLINTTSWTTGTPILLVDTDGNFTNATMVSSGSSGITIVYNPLTLIYTVTMVPASSGGLFPINGTPVFITPAVINFWPLSINNLDFTATKISAGVKLQWKEVTSAELDHFEIERSYNNSSWNSIAVINKTGNQGTEISYEVTDKQPAIIGMVYYRVKEVKSNSIIIYSAVKAIHTEGVLKIYPNPAPQNINITWGYKNSRSRIKIINAAAQIVKDVQVFNAASVDMNISNLPTGIYMVVFENNNIVIPSKLIKN